MLGTLLSVLFTAALSAFMPVTPIEPYLVVLATAGDQAPLPVSVAAAVGQTAGKLLIFLATRTTLRSGRLRHWAERVARRYGTRAGPTPAPAGPGRSVRTRIRTAGRRLIALLDRPGLVVPTVFVSAVAGVPPLLAVAVHAASTRVPAPVFALCCLTGRTVRFLAIMTAPELL
jgi:membrane protein YqaA with SNARE-associated domain